MSKIQELAEQTNTTVPKPTTDWMRLPIEGTPFWVIGRDNQYTVTMGKYRLHEQPLHIEHMSDWNQEEIEEQIKHKAEQYLYENQWDITLKMIAIAVQDGLTNKKN